jgi:hypothetical protein
MERAGGLPCYVNPCPGPVFPQNKLHNLAVIGNFVPSVYIDKFVLRRVQAKCKGCNVGLCFDEHSHENHTKS